MGNPKTRPIRTVFLINTYPELRLIRCYRWLKGLKTENKLMIRFISESFYELYALCLANRPQVVDDFE